jgi:glycerol-3-phosphate acyltransferase PlsY
MLVRFSAILAAYLLGAIPFGLILVRLGTGRDVRQSGSGNIGATNVLRTSGRVWGVLTLLLDAAKGAAGVLIARALVPGDGNIIFIAGLAAVLGHIFPVYLRFRGGKGVATCLGVFLVLSPLAVLPAIGVFVLLALISRTVSIGSLSAALVFPLAVWILDDVTLPQLAAILCCSAAVVYSHRSNIARIARGKENHLW